MARRGLGSSTSALRGADGASLALTRLRSGRHAMGREQVEGFQRTRMVSAMVEVAAEHGFLGAAVGRVVKRAGVSRRTFYDLFDSRENCFLAAFDWGVEQISGQLAEAYARESSWRDRVRSALASLLAFLDAEPQLARVCVVEALGAGTLVLERRARVLQDLAAALHASAPGTRGGSEPPLLTAEAVIGATFSVIHTRLSLGGEEPLTDLLGQLMALIALPYLGPRAAGEELARPAPEFPPPSRAADALAPNRRILERLNMRLTYRTVRCLLFVAEHPGASNRAVALGAEISDEGQASRLLMRLAGLDLLVRTCPGPGKPNSWRLTPHGEQVLEALPVA
ncbi:MAG TPA: TetR/AcrR family transcriptional regulator [Solirubrobacteraceae bacterium]|jgi:AcrR family transcriptional regulator|nr:TetR/AcrR family transcriptional regulator [Solirubrobacteraceae bacterium]